MTQPSQDEQIGMAQLDAALRVHGLSIPAEWRPDILMFMKGIGDAAQLVLEFPLDDQVESATIFTA